MSLVPTTYLARKALRLERLPQETADEIVTVCPAEEAVRPKAFHLPGQLDRVREFQAMDGPTLQLARITESPVTHSATRALRFRNAALVGGSLFAGGSRSQLTMQRPPRGPRAIRHSAQKVALVGTPISSIFFGHYLMDDSATTLMARDFGPVRSPANPNLASWKHALDYRRMMDLEVPQQPDAFISEAWVFDDSGMNSHRRARMQEVRRRLARQPADRSGHAVFIVRSRFGQTMRLLENEMELADQLAQRGFTIVNPMEEQAADIIRKIAGAALVVSVEGSALTHAYLTMQDNGAMVTIQPPYRFDNVWKDFTDLLGMKYGFVVAEGSRDGFRLDLGDLLRTIELVTG